MLYLNRRKQKALGHSPRPKAVTGSSGHRLVKTWVGESDGYTLPGWKFQCSCGTVGTAVNAKEGSSLGSEENAIQRFINHAKNRSLADEVSNDDKYQKLKAEFDAYREKCYCKDINSSLNV
jgi:hypothetical protein